MSSNLERRLDRLETALAALVTPCPGAPIEIITVRAGEEIPPLGPCRLCGQHHRGTFRVARMVALEPAGEGTIISELATAPGVTRRYIGVDLRQV
jgi:hypothetical protein